MEFEGKKACEFNLPDQNGDMHTMDQYKGRYVVIYFYPKALTPGCTIESKGFRDAFMEYENMDIAILGVSADKVERQKKFESSCELPFTLLADTEKDLCNKYGVWVEKSMFGKKYMGINRESFIIDPKGNIIKHYKKVKVASHAQDLLKDIKEHSNA